MKLKRVKAGHYQTPDGEYYVWQSPNPGYENQWYVNSETMDRECGETIFVDGFRTKWEAVEALGNYLKEERQRPEKQMPLLADSMETYEKHRVECWQCGSSDSERDVAKDDYAKWLYERGWRYVLSKKYATEGPVCPECVKELAEEGEC